MDNWLQCLVNPSVCAAQGAADAAAQSMWQSFLRWMAKGLTELTGWVFESFSNSTSPRFDQAWWRENLDLMVAISLPILVCLFVIQCVSAAVRREPGRLGHAVVGALIGTAGVPFSVAVIAGLGSVVDQISVGILGGNAATAEAIKRLTTITALQAVPTLGGSVLIAVILGLLAAISLYFVMLVREVALVAFVVFAPIAMASWTWSATRHWMRRWIEIVGALLFSKIAMALIFTLGLSAIGNTDAAGEAGLGTFLAGILLFAMAAFAPLATFSFIHWAGDHASEATHLFQQGATGATALKQRAEQGYGWAAHHFGGSSGGGDSSPVVGGDLDSGDGGDGGDAPEKSDLSVSPGAEVVVIDNNGNTPPPEPTQSSSGGTSATAVATSQVSVTASQPAEQSDAAGNTDTQGGNQQ
ncbi:hypothetical protein OG474_29395 [Kribbella sp. NBC_01505]|uniref:hypothetical protein n=1 Tax=Kribbella sp. NBC_01505 TaxID=2903580 RepID=UPI0038667E75